MTRDASGLAQVVVLWALLLLGALAASFAFSMRTEAQAARNGLDGERAYFQARTGISRALAELASAPPDNVVGRDISGGDGDAGYRVVVRSARGKVDVNLVSEGVLKELLRGAGLSAEEAEAMGDAILEWRDTSGGFRTHGAGDAYYASLAEPVSPRHGPLRSVEELRSVRGVTPEFHRRFLARVFTVDTKTPQVDINQAPREVLRALPGFSPELADAVLVRRAESPFRTAADLVSFLGGRTPPPLLFALVTTSGYSGVFSLTSTGTAGKGIVRVIECTVELGASGRTAARILRWADHVAADEEGG